MPCQCGVPEEAFPFGSLDDPSDCNHNGLRYDDAVSKVWMHPHVKDNFQVISITESITAKTGGACTHAGTNPVTAAGLINSGNPVTGSWQNTGDRPVVLHENLSVRSLGATINSAYGVSFYLGRSLELVNDALALADFDVIHHVGHWQVEDGGLATKDTDEIRHSSATSYQVGTQYALTVLPGQTAYYKYDLRGYAPQTGIASVELDTYGHRVGYTTDIASPAQWLRWDADEMVVRVYAQEAPYDTGWPASLLTP